ncbi:MAG TPA: pyridoxal 5'-phosphate synthase, partial [Flavobacteriales bacterium]|nr:pyridoxal 5'-phosphate synthase [Flavobacteriales bacterium]
MQNELNEFLGNDRKQFEKSELLENNTPAVPFDLFNLWLQQAIDNNLLEPYAMTLATSVDNKPSNRVVYLREIYANGYGFFTNYLSKKGLDLAKNPNASVLFFWPQVERQIRLEGVIKPASKEISDNYFNGRPRNSQVGAWASEQSKIIPSRETLN